MITVELADRRSKALGRLLVGDHEGRWVEPAVAKTLGLRPDEVRAKVELSEIGAAVAGCWEAIEKFYPQVRVIGLQVMPDHLHGLLFVTEPLACHLGQVVKGFKTGCNKAVRVLGPAILSSGTGLFADGFVDTIIWRDGQLQAERDYLAVALPGLAPSAWPYQPGEKPMTRFDATAMNRLCQWIAGEDAAEINYHGMKPQNVDALAKDAALVKEMEV